MSPLASASLRGLHAHPRARGVLKSEFASQRVGAKERILLAAAQELGVGLQHVEFVLVGLQDFRHRRLVVLRRFQGSRLIDLILDDGCKGPYQRCDLL